MMNVCLKEDSLEVLQEKASPLYHNSSQVTLVTGMLRFFKTTTVLNYCVKQPQKLIYVVRTNRTVEESIDRIREEINNGDRRQLVALRGKSKICPCVKKALGESGETYEVIKVKYCYNCPNRPRKGHRIPREILDDIENRKIIDTEELEEYYNLGYCPSEIIIHAARKFDTVFMTYTWLDFIKEVSSNTLKNIFKNSHVIMDEARHLMNYGVDHKRIGYEEEGVKHITEIDKIDKILNNVSPFIKEIRKKSDYKKELDYIIRFLELYKNFLYMSSYGSIGKPEFDRKMLYKINILMQKYIVSKTLLKDIRDSFEDALIICMWLYKNNNCEFFLDHQTKLGTTKESLILTARKSKEKLVAIIDETKKTFLIDSTPPPTIWSKLWLGKEYHIDTISVNPKTKPEIYAWVDGHDRRWTYYWMYPDKALRIYTFFKELIEEVKDEWIISTRSVDEARKLSKVATMGADDNFKHLPFKVIYQKGDESEGVQLHGHHILTGIQYLHPSTLETQKKYVAEQIGCDNPDIFWNEFLLDGAYATYVQQMFRTYYFGRPSHLILFGLSDETINTLKKKYDYLSNVTFFNSYQPLFKNKIREIKFLLKRHKIPNNIELLGLDIMETYPDYKSMDVKELWNKLKVNHPSLKLSILKLVLKKLE